LFLFGGLLSLGEGTSHLRMLDGYLEFFMEPELAEIYLKIKEDLDELIQKKLQNPNMDIYKDGHHLLQAFHELLLADQCNGRFVFGRQVKRPKVSIGKPL
jgi:ATP-dependent RNA helicase DHX36